MLGGAARHEVTGEGGLPKGKRRRAGRPQAGPTVIHGVASLTAPPAGKSLPLGSSPEASECWGEQPGTK